MCVCVEGEEKQCRLNQQNIDDSKICFLKLNQTILTDDIQSDLLDQGLVAGLAVSQTLVHGSVISPAHRMVKSWHHFKSLQRSLCLIQSQSAHLIRFCKRRTDTVDWSLVLCVIT